MKKLVLLFAVPVLLLWIGTERAFASGSSQVVLEQQTNSYTHKTQNLPNLPDSGFYTYLWWYGDGSYSLLDNPNHPYMATSASTTSTDVGWVIPTDNYGTGGPPPLSYARPVPLSGNPTQILSSGEFCHINHYRNAVPGDTIYVMITYSCSQPGDSVQGTITLDLGGYEQYFHFLPAINHPEFTPNGEQQMTQQLIWTYNELVYDSERSILVALEVDTEINSLMGEIIPFKTIITTSQGDQFEDMTEVEVSNSHDPNRITPNPLVCSSCDLGGKTIQYRVDFQNEGNGMASRVRVVVDLDRNLDLNSIQNLVCYKGIKHCHSPSMAQSSSACYLDSVLVQDHQLIVFFDRVVLRGMQDPNTRSEEQTQGWFTFEIDVVNPYQIGDDIVSQAHIYFDYNDAITTLPGVTTCKEKAVVVQASTNWFTPFMLLLLLLSILILIGLIFHKQLLMIRNKISG